MVTGMEKPYVVGMDIGGTNTVFGIVDSRGNVLATDSARTLGTARRDPARRTGRTGHGTTRRTVADARPYPRGHGADHLGGRRFRTPLSG